MSLEDDLALAHRGVVACVRALQVAGFPMPGVLGDALAHLDHIEAQIAAEAKRAADAILAQPYHFCAVVGDERTLCGKVPHLTRCDWAGVDGEGIVRHAEAGDPVCAQCARRWSIRRA